jgi:hypothetical protein
MGAKVRLVRARTTWLDWYISWMGTMVGQVRVGRVRRSDGYNDGMDTTVGRVRWLDRYDGWMGTMARPIRWLDRGWLNWYDG